MNLPAVILFICFSAVYGHQFKNLSSKSEGDSSPSDKSASPAPIHCTVGQKIVAMNKERILDPIRTEECPLSDNATCARVEFAFAADPGYFLTYSCFPNPNQNGSHFCQKLKDECFISAETVEGVNGTFHRCCSSDPKFTNLPAWSSSPPVKCKVGETMATTKDVSTKECSLGQRVLCGRMETVLVGSPGHFIDYYCSNKEHGVDMCAEMKDGECQDIVTEDKQANAKACCSSDPEFPNMPSIIPEDRYCYVGHRIIVEGSLYEEAKPASKKCPSVTPLCGRAHLVVPNQVDTYSTMYFCAAKRADWCQDKENGKCYQTIVPHNSFDADAQICCSSDPEFTNMPLPASSYPLWTLLAIIIPLLSLVI